MERYTNPDCKPEMEELMKDCPRSRSGAECWLRLCDIEDILGDNYDLDRLRELAQADREGKVPRYTIGDTVYDRCGKPRRNEPPGNFYAQNFMSFRGEIFPALWYAV